MSNHPEHRPLDYDYIADGIYIGTNVCCQAHFDERLVAEGITADISLEAERADAPFGVQFYLWLPVVDLAAPSPEQLRVGVTVLEALVNLKKKAYVHCKNGHGRAPTLVAAYLIKRGRSVEVAERFLAARRPAVHLSKAQREALLAWQRSAAGV